MNHLLGRRDARGHGGGVRGADLSRRSNQFQGRFGRMFRTLPAADFTDNDLHKLAHEGMTAEAEKAEIAGMLVRVATAENEVDDEENFGIPAGYTYFGQFIDHDLTFDPASSLQGQNDPDGLTDFRTPRFDLDSLFGRGPSDEPFMYEGDGKTFLLGREITRGGKPTAPQSHDLARAGNDRAIIGDKRNDENVIVSQLQGLFLRLHNRIVREHPQMSFNDVQREVRWHYQWVVLHDYLKRIVGEEMLHKVLPHLKPGSSGNIHDDKPKLNFFHSKNNAFIPVEFSVAAYRFGHSMVRPIYRLNTELGIDVADPTHTAGRQLIFASEGAAGLNGFRSFNPAWAIDWRLFFEMGATLSPNDTTAHGPRRVQPSYKIDTSLVNPLDFLPEFCKMKPGSQDLLLENDKPVAQTDPLTHKPEIPNLAHRNLLRGRSMGLPSGQTVARAMGLVPLTDAEIMVGKANVGSTFGEGGKAATNRSIAHFGASFKGNAPLWVYVLAEAQHAWSTAAKALLKPDGSNSDAANAIPVHLGPVGGRIVAETFVGLLLADSYSFLSQDPTWKPRAGWMLHGRFEMPQLVNAALG